MSGDMYYCPKSLDPDVPENWEKLEGVEANGYGSRLYVGDEVIERPATNYVADMTFKRIIHVGGRGYGKTQRMRELQAQAEESRNARVAEWVGHNLGVTLAPWQRSFMNGLLGQWQETPREELQRRLNNWLRGTYPGEPINWKGLK